MLDDEQFYVFWHITEIFRMDRKMPPETSIISCAVKKMSMGDRYTCTFIQKQRSMDSTEKRRE